MSVTSGSERSGIIHTERLELVPMSAEFLEACLNDDQAGAAAILGYPVDSEWFGNSWMLRRLEQLRDDPSLEPWLLRAVILRATRTMIGHTGFHTAPGADYLRPIAADGVELGYTIYPTYRRQGYATETVGALLAWAHQAHGVHRFVLSISPENLPSQRIAHHFHFRKVAEQMDEEDGLEEVFVLELG